MSGDAVLIESGVSANPLTQWQRVVSVFVDPLKTFCDIRNGNRKWGLPLLLLFAGYYVLFGTITYRVGWQVVVENAAKQRPTLQQQIVSLPEDERAQMLETQSQVAEIAFACNPLILFITFLVAAGLLKGTFMFVHGKETSFPVVFAVVVFSMLPTIVQSLLASIALLFNPAPDGFNIGTMYPTSLAAFLPSDMNPVVVSLSSSLDIVSVWSMILVGLGMSVLTGTSRKTGIMTVFLWWLVANLIRNGAAFILM